MQSSPHSRHVSEGSLILLALGDLPLSRSLGIRRHLLGCRRCREQREEVDEFVSLFRRAARAARAAPAGARAGAGLRPDPQLLHC